MKVIQGSINKFSMKVVGKVAVLGTSILIIAGCSTVQRDPMALNEIESAIEADKALFLEASPPLSKPLTLAEAMAHALKYNVNNRVRLMEQALADQSFRLAKMDMLPLLAANAGLTSRSNVDASSSESVETGIESLEPSTSTDQSRRNADLRLSWNALDFGVSYLKAKQEADRFEIARYERRDIMSKLLQETRAAYWKAAVTQELRPKIEELLQRTDKALQNLEKIQKEKLRAPVVVLQERRKLLSITRNLKSLQQSVDAAQIELANIINQPPSTVVALSVPKKRPKLTRFDQVDIEQLERTALSNNVDYIGELYNARIAQREAKKSMLRMFPGLEFSYAGNYDSNSYLYNSTWGQAGIRISWNIMRLFSMGIIKDQNEAREYMVEARRMAASMGVIAQVNLGWQQYRNAIDALDLSQQFEELDNQIAGFNSQARASSAISGTESLLSEARAVNSQLTNLLSYAEAQEAYGNFMLSVGFNPVPSDYQHYSIEELASVITQGFDLWTSGVPSEQQLRQFSSQTHDIAITKAEG
ncbi:TolC family protein [Neptunomonas phycophila]|uniref:TolC family protein n=1 Tax=Neptunomonas phycophila TaxID=1572645 RepID=UPI001BECE341|nr:TolC family protein [Neptunomonas phycophila]MBT3144905.1 TolC family protein [Neptunomonas phycophila]